MAIRMLRRGHSHKFVIDMVNKEAKREVSPSTIANWAKKAHSKPKKNIQHCATDRRSTPDREKFTKSLIMFLGQHFVTRKGVSPKQQYWYWHVEEIRFALLFRTLPPRIVQMQQKTSLMPADECPTMKDVSGWREWCNQQITAHLNGQKLSPEAEGILQQLREVCDLTDGFPFSTKAKFCERSIRLAMKNGGFRKKKSALRSPGSKVWIRK